MTKDNLRELALLPINSIGSLTVEEQAVKFIYDDLEDVKHKFVDIGFRLYEANKLKYFEQLGYANIEEMSEDLFGFQKSSTYSLMSICEKFCDGGMRLLPKYEKFSQSQLAEMVAIEYIWQRDNISPECTVAQIREYKKALKYRDSSRYVLLCSRGGPDKLQKIIDGYYKYKAEDEAKKVQTSGNPDVLPGQTSIFDDTDDYYDTDFDEDGNEIVHRVHLTDLSKIDDVEEMKYSSRRPEKVEYVQGGNLNEQELPENACVPCYGKNLEDMFVLTDDVGKTVYIPGLKFCPLCGRKLYARFDCKGGKR